uniref:thioesterase domain-containing protein n=1 Tax=Anaeromyxobacter oryzisoli TaxID=2925408 RepID=UPI001F584C90
LARKSPASIPADRPLLELGLDSLMAVQLRNRLASATGLPLPVKFPFECRTATRMVQSLLRQLGLDAGSPEGGGASRRGALGDHGREVFTKLTEAARSGETALGWELLRGAARARRDAERPARYAPELLRLARGSARPGVVCFPSFVPPTAVQYARFASPLRELRDVWVLDVPGYVPGEPLAPDLATLVQTAAKAVVRSAARGPFAIVGYSSGGFLAHAVTRHLEDLGVIPSALVLLDTPATVSSSAPLLDRLAARLLAEPRHDVELTAMSWYLDLFATWAPAEVAAPILFASPAEVRADDAPRADRASSPRWPFDHALLEVPGDHFSMMDRHAEAVARMVHGWLGERSPARAGRAPCGHPVRQPAGDP